MSRALNDLDARFKPLAIELLARSVEAGIPVMIIDTLRTAAEHQANLATGVSWIQRSKHLDGLAIDICPYDVFRLDGSDKLMWRDHPSWHTLGRIGEGLGLQWGGRWSVKDWGHFQYVVPTSGTVDV